MTNKYFNEDESWALLYLILFIFLALFITLSYAAYLEEDLTKETLKELTYDNKST